MTEPIDESRQRRCPRLGHEVPLSYCRQPASENPCRKIRDCWFETIDIDLYLQQHCTAEQLHSLTLPPVDKMSSLLELIQQAQERMKKPPPPD